MDEAWRKIKQEGQQKEYEEEKMADGGPGIALWEIFRYMAMKGPFGKCMTVMALVIFFRM